MSTLKWRPSPALLVAALAISIALVGTAAAGPIDNPIAQDSRLTKKDRRITSKIARKIAVRIIRRISPRITNRQITQRAPNLSVANAQNANGVDDGAISTGKLADNAVTGEKINDSSTPFGRVVHTAEGNSTQALGAGLNLYPLNNNTYTQDAGENNTFISGVDVTFQASCTAPRSATAILLVDAANPASPTPNDFASLGIVNEAAGGQVSKRINLAPYFGGGSPMLFRPSSNQQRKLDLIVQRSCSGGTSGVNATFAGVDVIGTK